MSKDRYRRVRQALRRIKNYIQWVEETYPNRAARRRAFFEGEELKKLHHQLHVEKTRVSWSRPNEQQAESRMVGTEPLHIPDVLRIKIHHDK